MTSSEFNNLQQSVPAEQLKGVVERLTFHNEENGFSVLRVNVGTREMLATVVGVTAMVRVGDHIECEGEWGNDKTHGVQFRATSIHVVPPSTHEGIERFLNSGLVQGIGPHFAKELLNRFGERVFEVIEREPQRLSEIPGLGKKRRAQLLESWAEQRAVRDIMVYLQSHGIGPARAVRIYKTYGDEAIHKVQENPYRLALDIHGIGFKIADALALSIGLPEQSLMRSSAGVRHVLQEFASQGHCAVAQSALVQATVKLLAIPAEQVQAGIDAEVDAGRLIRERINEANSYFLAPLQRAEVYVARRLLRLLQGERYGDKIEVLSALEWVMGLTGLLLSPSQQAAIATVLGAKVAVITGGPGVGKTTVVNSILQIARAAGVRVLLCAPTGRAAKRLSESTGLEAKTIHRLLEFDPLTRGFKRNSDSPLESDLLVVDEMSMVDITLMQSLLQAVPNSVGLLLVGDVDQLPSVGPGAVLGDIIRSERVATARLTEIFRQAASSKIIVNAHRINQGELPIQEDTRSGLTDFYFIACETPEQIHDKVIQLVSQRIPNRFHLHPIRDIQVLTPMNKGGLGTKSLNLELQKVLNPNQGPALVKFGFTYALGDKVIQLVNNYDKEVFNGDIGFIDFVNAPEGVLHIDFEGRSVVYNSDELDEVALAYATTIHKAQGSEYPAVVMPLATQHYTLLERNLLYTGVTRGKKLVVIVGQAKALRIAIDNIRATERVTKLAQRLREG